MCGSCQIPDICISTYSKSYVVVLLLSTFKWLSTNDAAKNLFVLATVSQVFEEVFGHILACKKRDPTHLPSPQITYFLLFIFFLLIWSHFLSRHFSRQQTHFGRLRHYGRKSHSSSSHSQPQFVFLWHSLPHHIIIYDIFLCFSSFSFASVDSSKERL